MRRMIDRVGNERGTTAVVVALMLVMLLGFGAIVIDVGALYRERRELQNGADAGALAVAQDCSTGDCADYNGTASTLAPANADDGLAAVDGVAIDMTARTVKVDTSTSDADGGTQVLHWFAPLLGNDGSTVRASATAQWGPAATAPALPLVFSQCEFDRLVGDPDNLPSGEATVTFLQGNNAEPCNGSAGLDLPGGFGWLRNSACEVVPDVDEGGVWVSANVGAAVPSGCSPPHFPLSTPLLFPVFDDTQGQGALGRYHVVGFVAFELSGYKLHTGLASWKVGNPDCGPAGGSGPAGGGSPGGAGTGNAGNAITCVTGRFVRYFEADSVLGGPLVPDFGVTTVQLIA